MTVISSIFSIAVYEKIEDGFIKIGYKDYSITYAKSGSPKKLRIVVNGHLTKSQIKLFTLGNHIKSLYLEAIKDYELNKETYKQGVVKKNLKLQQVEQLYSKKLVTQIKTYLTLNRKEDSRDCLTKYGLILKLLLK